MTFKFIRLELELPSPRCRLVEQGAEQEEKEGEMRGKGEKETVGNIMIQ